MITLNLRCRSIALLGVFLLGQTSAFAVTIPVKDDAVAIQANPTLNYGRRPILDVSSASNANRWVYINFGDIRDYLPSGTTANDVKKASMVLYVNELAANGAIDVCAVDSSWNEGTKNGVAETQTVYWNNRPTTGQTLATIPLTTTPTPPATNNDIEFIRVDMTGIVQDWITNHSENYGIVIKPNGSVQVNFDSKENDGDTSAGASHSPVLEVELDTGSANTNLSAIASGTWTGANSINTLGTITAGTWSGTTISVLKGGTGATNAPDARLNLGLVIGSNVQAWSGALDDLADGSLSGALIGSGISASNISAGTLGIARGGTGSSNGSITGTGALTFASGGTNTSITLTPTGTGVVALSSDATINGLTFGRGKGSFFTNLAAGNAALSSNTTGQYNVAIGDSALAGASTISGNTAVGAGALQVSTNGASTAVGYYALNANTTGFNNTALGASALLVNTTGVRNVAVGAGALVSNTAGDHNLGIGHEALKFNTTGGDNIGAGRSVLYNNIDGTANVVIGNDAMLFANSNANVALGRMAGTWKIDDVTPLFPGAANIYIGTEAKGFSNGETNSIVIGYRSIGEGSNKTVIGNVTTDRTHTFGSLLIGGGTTAPELRILEASGTETYATGFKAPNLTADVVYTLPAADGETGQVLTTNGGKILSWTTISNTGAITLGTWEATPIADAFIASHDRWDNKQDALEFGPGLTNTGGTITIGNDAITNDMLEGGIDITSKVGGILSPINGGTGQSTLLNSADALEAKGNDIASDAGTTNLADASGVFVNITGGNTINAFGEAAVGVRRWVRFTGGGTITHSAALILPGAAHITRAAGDCAIFESLGVGNWRCLVYHRANGSPVNLRVPRQGDISMGEFDNGPQPPTP